MVSTDTSAGPTQRTYTILLEPEADGSAWNVRVPALPGCFTYGRTKEEAIRRAEEAIQVFIESLEADGVPLPEDITVLELARVTVSVP